MNSHTILSSVFLILGTAFCLPFAAVANNSEPIPVESVKPPTRSTGTLQDLNQIQAKDTLDWPWAVGGGSEDQVEGTETTLYQIDAESYVAPPTVNDPQEEQSWQQSNLGDPIETPALVPIADF